MLIGSIGLLGDHWLYRHGARRTLSKAYGLHSLPITQIAAIRIVIRNQEQYYFKLHTQTKEI